MNDWSRQFNSELNPAPMQFPNGGLARIEVRGNVFDDLAQSSKALLQQAGDLLDQAKKGNL